MADTNTENRGVGQPTVMTTDTLDKLRQAFLMGCSDEEACIYAKIGTTTLYNYQKEHPEYVEEKRMMKKAPLLLARKTVYDSLDKNLDSAWKYLERKRKKEFGTRTEITGANGKPLIPNKLSEEEAKEIGSIIKEQMDLIGNNGKPTAITTTTTPNDGTPVPSDTGQTA